MSAERNILTLKMFLRDITYDAQSIVHILYNMEMLRILGLKST